jgi:hypothetical protein
MEITNAPEVGPLLFDNDDIDIVADARPYSCDNNHDKMMNLRIFGIDNSTEGTEQNV